MKTPQEKFRRPEIFLQELLRKYAKGQILDSLSNVKIFHRAVVLAVDVIGGQLSNPAGSGAFTVVYDGKKSTSKATIGPENPKNSVKAMVITNGFDSFTDIDDARTFWPMFQADHVSIPVKPGEYVFVAFEDEHFENGLWMCKVSGHDGQNLVIGRDTMKRSVKKTAADIFDSEQQDRIDEPTVGDFLVRKNLNESFD